MTTPPSVQTIIAHHLRALAGQDDSTLAQQQRDAAIRTLLEAEVCPQCGGDGRSFASIDTDHDWPCADCAGTGKPPRASTIAQLVTDASPQDRGLSRQRVDQIVKGRR
jgi:DnaJ-class molecular chaperone